LAISANSRLDKVSQPVSFPTTVVPNNMALRVSLSFSIMGRKNTLLLDPGLYQFLIKIKNFKVGALPVHGLAGCQIRVGPVDRHRVLMGHPGLGSIVDDYGLIDLKLN
jgi:hypothetical protein